MTAAIEPSLREQAEDFLFREAALLDEWRLDDWSELFTEDARYVVPTPDLPEGDPERDLVLIDDDMARLRGRIKRLNSRHAHREHPRSRTRRFVSNIRVQETDDGVFSVKANVLVYRIKNGDAAPYVGSIAYILRWVDGDLKIAHRRAVLDLEDFSWHGALSIIF